MGFLTSLLGSENIYLTAVIGLGIVVILIIVGVWLLKLVSDASRTAGRGRSRRLGVVDSVALDQRRQAILLRRDNVEHLIITGGPQDFVVETGIEAPAPARNQARTPDPRLRPERKSAARSEGLVRGGPPEAPPRPLNAARQRVALRNTGLLRPVSQSEPLATGGIGQNSPRDPSDSDRTEVVLGEDDQGPGYETVELGEIEHEYHRNSDDKRRDEH